MLDDANSWQLESSLEKLAAGTVSVYDAAATLAGAGHKAVVVAKPLVNSPKKAVKLTATVPLVPSAVEQPEPKSPEKPKVTPKAKPGPKPKTKPGPKPKTKQPDLQRQLRSAAKRELESDLYPGVTMTRAATKRANLG
jgi:outer membrane biosynthesis protein TonB